MILPACGESESLDMVLIPGGSFELGIDPQHSKEFFNFPQSAALNARPAQKLQLPAFYMDRFEVTYGDFMRFKPRAKYDVASPNEPIRGVSWYEADAYCLWTGKRLPTEFEWEKAARGSDGRLFVWGNDFELSRANLGQTVKPVGYSKTDLSIFGVSDMNGNVAEWTRSWYEPYPNSDYKDDNFGKRFKVTRGGAVHKSEHGFMKEFTMIPYRNFAPAASRFWDTGFRCARSVKAPRR